MIDKEKLITEIKGLFYKLIDEGQYTVDVLDISVDILRIIDELGKEQNYGSKQ